MTNINLPVPFFTQRDNTYVWYYKHEEDIVIKKVLYKKGSFIADAEGKQAGCTKWLPQKPYRSNSLRKCGGKTAKSG